MKTLCILIVEDDPLVSMCPEMMVTEIVSAAVVVDASVAATKGGAASASRSKASRSASAAAFGPRQSVTFARLSVKRVALRTNCSISAFRRAGRSAAFFQFSHAIVPDRHKDEARIFYRRGEHGFHPGVGQIPFGPSRRCMSIQRCTRSSMPPTLDEPFGSFQIGDESLISGILGSFFPVRRMVAN